MANTECMSMWVIYEHPRDYPNDYIAREWYIEAGKKPEPSPVTFFKAPEREVVERFVQAVCPDAIGLLPNTDDDPCIIGIWM